ncbi:hypothetical protein KGF54_004465 [Candida jiufengensis]|uniref:uncharacterized protein n=1 Tax=Candida jiufengensis TaxID=497108 RepID=UPI0022244ECB|nr:uncharacterized protein KGF54_004465 [Candida jiufengensis]KAI5951391.1 hypothetical protein KGF54_004465 [Candida jiufengensis]
MSDNKKRKTYSSVNVDYQLIDKLNQVIESNDLQKLSQFIDYGNLGKLLPIWSYYSSTNNHQEFVETTNKINNILYKINESKNSLLSQKQIIIDTYKDILINYSKTIYRALTSLKPSSTNPTIRLLNNLISYDYIISVEFINQFDFSLPVLPKLLVPTKIEIENETNDVYSIRSSFLKFYINLCSLSNYINRLDLLSNFKIIRNIWKYVEYDTEPTSENLFNFLSTKVLDESNFKKAQKCKILNDNFMYKVQILLTKIKEPFFMEFMTKLTTDYKNGLVFPNEELWNENSNIGVEIVINNKTFKIANKLLYTLLTTLKPTNANKEIQFIVKILSSCQELIPPYMNYLVQHGGGYNDPSLTSWWISHTLLYSNVLQISLPQFEMNLEFYKFDAKLITESIVFAPTSKGVSVAGLISDKGLIVQLTLQLILYMLIRLEKILNIVNVRQELISSVFNSLPDLSSIAQAITKNPSSKIIQLTALTIINKYENLKPNSVSNTSLQKLISTGVTDIVSKPELNTYDLSILDIYMSLQNQDFKWWNKINGQNSFFTTLIKLTTNNNISTNYITKIYQLLNKLTKDKMFFNDNLLITPILSLIYSINSQMSPKFWNMIDETIARCIRTPYKYLDIAHSEYNDLSIFVVALVEQFKFIEQNEDNIYWLRKFFKYLTIFGNGKEELQKLYKTINEKALDSSSTTETASSSQFILDIAFNYSTKSQISKIIKALKDKIITSDVDFLAVIYLLQQTNDLNNTLFPMIWDYLISSNQKTLDYFTTELVWKSMLNNNKSESYNEILKNLPKVNTKYLASFVCEQIQNQPSNNAYDKYFWTLSDEQIISLKDVDNEAITVEFMKRKLTVNFDQFWRLIKANNNELTSEIIKLNLIEFTDNELNQVVDELMKTKNLTILPDIINRYHNVATQLLDKNIQNDNLNCLIAASMIQQDLEMPQNFVNSVLSIIEKQLKNKDVTNWNQVLVILSSQENKLEEQVLEQIDFKQTLNAIFIKYIAKVPEQKLTNWLHKSVLYITKSFAELDSLTSKFNEFLLSFGDYVLDSKMWDLVPSSVLNTQIEVIFRSKFIQDEKYLKYIIKLSIIAPRKKIDYEKLFQISLTSLKSLNELPTVNNKTLKYYSSFIIYILFNFDHQKLSTLSNLENLLEKYQGLNNIEDQIIKTILKKIESKISKSWILKVSNWEFSELSLNNDLFQMDNLITKKNNQFIVTLNKGIIQNSLNEEELVLPPLKSGKELWSQIGLLEIQNPSTLTYDFEFLIMIILNNEELLKFNKLEDGTTTTTFNIKNLIDTGILQFIVSNLSNQYQSITSIILNKILLSLDNDSNQFFKDKNIFKVYLSIICFTLQQDYKLSDLTWFIYSQFIPIISNPGHFLYEKACRYLLSHPKLNKFDIPLYNLIFKAVDTEFYYRELTWLIEVVTQGLKTKDDLVVLNKFFIESVLNLLNSKIINMKLRTTILSLIYKIQSIDQGSDLLITRFGILSDLQLLSNELNEEKTDDNENIFNDQLKLNFNEITTRFGVADSKRIETWSNFDFRNNLKRIHDEIK